MDDRPIVFVAFEEQDNLGIGYLASTLMEAGFQVRIVDFRVGQEAILASLLRFDPLVVGFSVIFQHHIDRFRDLIRFLRDSGIGCHFSAGGHYPSLRYRDLLGLIPELDSVVLFEGEITFLELVQALAEGREWRGVQGLAYAADGTIAATPLRPLERDLDRFPLPVRLPSRTYAFDQKFATILAGRGCVYNCVFCSIQQFYSAPPGPLKRVRRPELVVQEMVLLHREKGCTIFMFQDDDFPITYNGGAWLAAFCRSLEEAGLAGQVMWKINCRPDEVNSETFELMQAHGLFLVYLGIESGTDEGLRLMNKHTKAGTNLQATRILKDLGIVYDYGFMLFDPWTSFESIARNLDFLDELCGDGSSPVTFCKMLPYAGTEVERMLLAENRLAGRPGSEDYSFLDRGLDDLYQLMAASFADWIGDHDGLLNLARWIRHYVAVYRHYCPASADFETVARSATAIIGESNLAFTRLVRQMAALYRPEARGSFVPSAANALQAEARRTHDDYRVRLDRVMSQIEGMGS